MNSIKDSRLLQRNASLAATTMVALCCQITAAIGAEPTSPKSTPPAASTAKQAPADWGTPRKLQWQPMRNGATANKPAERNARYEEDVFADGPSLTNNAKRNPRLNGVIQAQQKTPFDDPDPPKQPTPTPTPPTDTIPEPMPVPGQSPPTFPTLEPTPTPGPAPTTTPEPMPTPSPGPATTPTPGPAPTPFEEPPRAPEPDRQPRIFLEPPSSPLDSEFSRTNRPPPNPAQDCEEAYNHLKKNTIDKLSVKINIAGKPGDDLPYECTLSSEPFDPRCWRLTTYTWKASALCHKPIYFEEEHLERYGHSHGPGCEYLVSFAHFFGNVILLPYHMGVETPCECIYTLGVYRAGSCAPYMLDPFPISLRGAAFGAVGYCGTVALFP
jgi:hypothetical protein